MPIFHRDSFPPGEAKGQLRELVPFNELLTSVSFWAAAPQREATSLPYMACAILQRLPNFEAYR